MTMMYTECYYQQRHFEQSEADLLENPTLLILMSIIDTSTTAQGVHPYVHAPTHPTGEYRGGAPCILTMSTE